METIIIIYLCIGAALTIGMLYPKSARHLMLTEIRDGRWLWLSWATAIIAWVLFALFWPVYLIASFNTKKAGR